MNMHSISRLLIFSACILSSLSPASRSCAQASNFDDALQVQKRADEYLQLISAGAPGFDRTVTDKAFSATAITETTRILEDGHRIVRRNVMNQFRDQQGRTRREQTLEALSPSTPVAPKEMIFIFDPVLHVNYVIDRQTRVAREFAAISNSAASKGSPFPASSQGNPSSLSPATTVEDLGKRLIEGLRCSGTRTTTTLPKGLIGNDAPLITVRETWFSPDIQELVQSKTVDPRFGTTDYHLTNIKRSDPAPEQFRVPPSYKVERVPR